MLDHIQNLNRMAYISALNNACKNHHMREAAQSRLVKQLHTTVADTAQKASPPIDIDTQEVLPAYQDRILKAAKVDQPELSGFNPAAASRTAVNVNSDQPHTKEKVSAL